MGNPPRATTFLPECDFCGKTAEDARNHAHCPARRLSNALPHGRVVGHYLLVGTLSKHPTSPSMIYLAVITFVHVAISLVALAAGLFVVDGMLRNERLDRWTSIFLWTTVATSVTGFLFPFKGFLPAHALAVISLLVLPVAIYARSRRPFSGVWVKVYVVTSLFAFYLNVFVLVVQAFLKLPQLTAVAPKQNEPPFVVAQVAVLVVFLIFGALAFKRFRPQEPSA